MFEVENQRLLKTIKLRLDGYIEVDEMKAFVRAYRAAIDAYEGAPHLVLADMRGLSPSPPEASKILQEAIGYDRQRGAMRCVHLADRPITRMQVRRLARDVTPYEDRITIDVATLEEAEEVLRAQRKVLRAVKAEFSALSSS